MPARPRGLRMLLVAGLAQYIGSATASSIVDPTDGKHTECAVRSFAYTNALARQPHRAPLLELFDALQLATLCGAERPQPLPIEASTPRVAAVDSIGLHVVPGAQRRGASGSAAAPFATVRDALNAARRARVTPPPPLLLHNGIHFLNATLVLRAEDSGQVITAAPGCTSAWLSGGVALDDLRWKPHSTMKNVLFADVSKSIPLGAGDVTGLFTVDEGDFSPAARLTRSRFPNGNWETDMWGLCSTPACLDVGPAYTTPERWGGDPHISLNHAAAIPKSDVASWWTPRPKALPMQSAFYNTTQGGHSCDPGARNCTTYEFTEGCGGPCALWSSVDSDASKAGCSYWCGENCGGGGAGLDSHMSKTGWLGIPLGVTLNKSSAAWARMQRWKHPSGQTPIVHAWMDSSWFTNMFAVTSFDAASGNLSFDDPAMPGFPKGGWQGGRNWRTGSTSSAGETGGESTVAPLILENVLEETDAPGEYFWDVAQRQLLLVPNATAAENANLNANASKAAAPPKGPKRLVATKLQTLVRIAGSKAHPVRGVRIENVHWRDAAHTYMERWGVPSGGDWSLYHGAALEISGAEDVVVSGGRWERLDNNAILLSGYTRGVQLVNNTAAWLGMNWAAAWGDTDGIDATQGTQPRGTIVESNFVREMGIFEKQSSAWFQAKACGTLLRNNIFVNGPRAAINFNDGFGGNNSVVGNTIWNMCRESGDHGPINSWDRLPFLTHIKYGNDEAPSYEALPSTIARNVISADFGGSQAFDNDDGSSYYESHHNFFYSSDGVKMDYKGHDSEFHHNLVVVNAYDGQNCLNGGGFPSAHRDSFHDNKCILAGCRGGKNRSNHHAACQDIIGNFACDAKDLNASMASSWKLYNNEYYTVHGNASLPCGVSIADAAAGGSGVEKGSSAHMLPTDAELIVFAKALLVEE